MITKLKWPQFSKIIFISKLLEIERGTFQWITNKSNRKLQSTKECKNKQARLI